MVNLPSVATSDPIAVASTAFYGNGTINAQAATTIFEMLLTDLKTAQNALDVFFTLSSGNLVFVMQIGFAMLTAGSIRSKNTKNVLLKNILDACVGAIAYYIFGWAFAFGPGTNRFIGYGNFALSSFEDKSFDKYHKFFFEWAFAATATTIVSGAVAERTSFYAYLGYAFFLAAWVYPVVAHWVWSGDGWLTNLFSNKRGAVDFAGCIVVHTVGGIAGLCGAVVVGPRLGRFDSEGKVVPIPGHSASMCTLGTFLLWFGWYGFNPGSALGLTGKLSETASRAAVNTTLSASTAGLVTLLVIRLRDHIFDLLTCLNGLIAGLVSITAACAFVEPYAAIIIGAVGACVYIAFTSLTLKLKIDDPLEAFPIHSGAGLWGAVAGGLFNRKSLMEAAGVFMNHHGLFYGGGVTLLIAQLIGVISAAAWTAAFLLPLFTLMHAMGVLRIPPEEEIIGNDVSKHGGAAYINDDANLGEYPAAMETRQGGMEPLMKATEEAQSLKFF